MCPSQQAEAGATPGPRRTKRVSWTIDAELYDMLIADAKRMCLSSVNAALNVDLAELREWRLGKRRFVENSR